MRPAGCANEPGPRSRSSESGRWRSCAALPCASECGVGSGARARQHPPEQRQRPGLPQRLVQIPALRRLHARWTTALAGAALEQAHRVGDPILEHLVAALADADAAGVTVVDEDRRLKCLRVQVGGEAADCLLYTSPSPRDRT